MVAALVAAWLLLSAAACAQREQDFYDFKAVNIRGKLVSLEKYRGSVSVHPRGLGATPAGPDGGAPWPWALLGVAPRGLLPPGDTAQPPRPHPSILSGGARHRQILLRVCPATTWHGSGARRNPKSSQPAPISHTTISGSGSGPLPGAGRRGPSFCQARVEKVTLASCCLCLSHPQIPHLDEGELLILSAVRTLWK